MKRRMFCGVIAALAFTAVAWAAVDPVEVEVYFQNGVKFMKRGLYEKSIREFEKTLALDPAHQDARLYLDQVKELYSKASPVAAKASEDRAMRVLYQDGRSLFKKGEYEKAIEVFNQILAKKPVDDFASFYRERSEIMIARRMHKERKAQERQRRIEDQVRQKDTRRLAKQNKVLARQEKLEKRALIQDQRRQARQDKTVLKKAPEASSAPEETQALTPRQAKIRAARERREEALRRAEERREEKRQARLDKIDARAQARARVEQKRQARLDSKNMEKEQALEKKESARVKKALSAETQRENKELFIMGLEAYSQKEYDRAIGFLNQLIDAEKETGPVYTSTARRIIDKARKRQEGVGQDVKI